MEFKHEFTRVVNCIDAVTLEHRLMAVAAPSFYKNRQFNSLHSLYFSSEYLDDTEEFVLCYYNDGKDGIRLVKINNQKDMSCSEYCEVTREFVKHILDNDYTAIVTDPMGKSGDEVDPLLQEFYWMVIGNGLRPKHILDFDRKSFIHASGEVIISIDYNRKISFEVKDFLNPNHFSSVLSDDKLLKVEWESYLPDVIRSAIDLSDYQSLSFVSYGTKALYV